MSFSSVICRGPLIASQGRWVFLQPLCAVRSLHFRVVADHQSCFFASSVRLDATLRAVKVTHCTQLRSMVLQASLAPPPMLISVDDLINKMQNVTISEVTLFLCYAKSVLLAGPVCH